MLGYFGGDFATIGKGVEEERACKAAAARETWRRPKFERAKQTKGSFLPECNVCKRPLEVVHIDVWGLIDTISIHGCRYHVSFVDDHTRKVWVYFMCNKSEVFDHLKDFKVMA